MTNLHREKVFDEAVPKSGYLWCLHCERAYKYGEYREVASQWNNRAGIRWLRRQGESEEDIAVMLEPLQMCPYPDCNGDSVIDAWNWEQILAKHSDYPKVPVAGVVYPLY